ncbi:MAG: PorV/PorQ family protein [Deferribacteres bacterium]|nr:PorV/PorQ family protein [candidate division KSB1 bacterium]MCB9500625.1 PorV/PorQ family protein [Deferribacteres bacterium]
MKMNTVLYSITLTILCVLQPVFAQDGGQAGAFLRLGAGVRADGVGGAFTAIANDASAGYWNPAGLAQINQAEIIASYHKLSLDRNFNFVSAAMPLGRSGSIGLSWIGLSINSLEARTGDSSTPDFEFSNQENALLLTYGHRLNSHFALGLNTKLIMQKLATESAMGVGFDLAALYQLLPAVRFGLSVSNIGASTTWSNNYKEKLPMMSRLGTAVNLTDNFLISTDMVKIQGMELDVAFGFEYTIWKMLPLRMGYNQGEIGGGLGILMPLPAMNLSFDYAMGADAMSQSTTHKFSLSIMLHGRKREAFEDAVLHKLNAHLPEGKRTQTHVAQVQQEKKKPKNASNSPKTSDSPFDQFFSDGDFSDSQGNTSMPAATKPSISDWAPTESKQSTVNTAISNPGLTYYTTNVSSLNVRSAPSQNAPKVGTIRRGQKVRIAGKKGNWVKIQVGANNFGWVYNKYIERLAE